MKSKYIAVALTSALFAVGLIPAASAQDDFGSAQAGIEVITVVGKRPVPQEGVEVITVVGKRPEPTLASTCVNEVMAERVADRRNGGGYANAQTLELRQADRNSVRQAIRNCIDLAQAGPARS